MILEKGNMWDAFGKGIFMITTNPIIRNDGAVVMGRGIALEAKTKYPTLPYDFGKQLKAIPPYSGEGCIGHIKDYDNVPIWWFMVKDHWRDNASLKIIRQSVFDINHRFVFNGQRIDLNFPGIGNGKLQREDVLPLLVDLPDNVHVWEYE